VERLRQSLTEKQPHRCHQCGWRRWRELTIHEEHPPVVVPDDLRVGGEAAPVSAAELDQLDLPTRRS
jgi:hypothetical protein